MQPFSITKRTKQLQTAGTSSAGAIKGTGRINSSEDFLILNGTERGFILSETNEKIIVNKSNK